MTMTRDAFLRKHGPLRIAEELDRHFARLRQPHFENGEWDRIDRRGPKILNGRFYNIGYFPEAQDPAAMDHDWEALDASMALASEFAARLKAGGCYALQSEGDAPYFPFVSTTCVRKRALDFDLLRARLPEALEGAYSEGVLRANYSRDIQIGYGNYRRCVFWQDSLDDAYASDLSPEAYQAYRQVSDRMRAELEVPLEVSFYSDFIEFPVLYGGVDLYGHFVGVLTSCVWT